MSRFRINKYSNIFGIISIFFFLLFFVLTLASFSWKCNFSSSSTSCSEKLKFPDCLIGYTEFRTYLTGGRQANVSTMRAMVVKADGSGRRYVAEELTRDPNTSTQFAGWSPDGRIAVIGKGWKSPENAKWEEENKTFRHVEGMASYDDYFVDIENGKAINVTAIDRVSHYNSGLFFWPKDSSKLGFSALINDVSHPFWMDIDGGNKTDLTKGSKDFTYGFNASRDGKRIAYHRDYQVYIANADGSDALHVNTGQPFNFGPQWSPDGNWILFLSGEKNTNCNPYLVRFDGTGLIKLADRNGYKGAIEFLDVYDFHEGSSDVPVWSADGKAIFYTACVGNTVELFRVYLDGTTEQLTHSNNGVLHYHPNPSSDGQWLLYGSKREGVRQLFVMRLSDFHEQQITKLKVGYAAMWPQWQPNP